MRSDYVKPTIEFEEYELNTTIATGCDKKVSLGPEIGGYKACEEYRDAFIEGFAGSPMSLDPSEQNFYENICSCYLSAGGETVFTS